MQEDREEIERNIRNLNRMLAQTPNGHPKIPLLRLSLGIYYDDRFDLSDEPDDINKAIENASIALSMTSNNDPKLLDMLDLLGGSHTKHFRRIGKVENSEKGIEYKSRAIALTPKGHPEFPIRLTNLGVSFSDRYKLLGEPSDLEKAIEYESRAVLLTLNGHPGLPMCLSNLGLSHCDRYQRLGELDDLEKAITYNSRAVALTPGGDPFLPAYLSNLAMSHRDRCERLGELNDLEKAMKYDARAVALTPNGHPDLPMRLTGLGRSYTDRYKRLGKLKDLEKAIECDARAVALTPEDHPELSSRLANLGNSYNNRYQRSGELNDLEEAIKSKLRAVVLTPESHPHLPNHLAGLGGSHSDRYERLGELDDLDKAIEYSTRAVELTPDGHPYLPVRLSNLGGSHNHRYQQLGKLDDLRKAIECSYRAVSSTPDDHPDLPIRLVNLGVSQADLFQQQGELNDLEKAIECDTRAVALTPDGHPDLPIRLMNLGASHNDRYKWFGEVNDLDKAIECQTRVIALLPDEHPSLPMSHFNSALTSLTRYTRSGDPSHLQGSLNSFRYSSQVPTGPPRAKFNNAFKWAKKSSIHDSLNPIEAYQTTIDLLPQFIWLGATTHQRYQDLATTQTLAVDAACTAIHFSKSSLALEWLEQARCVVWNQSLMLRSPLDQLQAGHPTLAARLQTVANQLHSAGSQSRESKALSSGPLTIEQVAQEHRRLATEYDELITQARQIPGFTDFLRPMKATGLVHAARYGPVAVINCHEDRCDALLILPGRDEIQQVPLPEFTGKEARLARSRMQNALRSKGVRERGVKHRQAPEDADTFRKVLTGLWYKVVKPVLDFLGYTNNTQLDNLPHITWCPTGIVSFLPLHAAGDYDQPRSRVFDYVVSSYTPTVSALLASNPTTLSPSSKVLAIGQESTPGHSPLPETARELEYIQTHVQSATQYTQLSKSQATVSAVLDAMEAHDWVHLACHAHQNVSDPTKSGFFLHDGTLDLATINQRSFKNKGLAFLSACQTAKGDEELPDEAIHLASGMLMVGYSSVIATMWSVFDADAPLVTNKVYEELLRD